MRPTQLATQLRCAPQLLHRRRFCWRSGTALWALLAPGCVTPAAPVERPAPVPVVYSKPAAPPVAVSAPPTVAYAALPDIIIHQADLHGQFEHKQGGTITIHALLMMTKTQPAVGNKGVLFYGPPGAHADADWIPLGSVEVKKPLDPEGKLQVQCIDDDKKFVIPAGKKSTPLIRKTRLRLRWEY